MKKSYKLKNLGCANCAAKMEREIKKLRGVSAATVSFMTERLTIEAEDEQFSNVLAEAAKICSRIESGCVLLV